MFTTKKQCVPPRTVPFHNKKINVPSVLSGTSYRVARNRGLAFAICGTKSRVAGSAHVLTGQSLTTKRHGYSVAASVLAKEGERVFEAHADGGGRSRRDAERPCPYIVCLPKIVRSSF